MFLARPRSRFALSLGLWIAATMLWGAFFAAIGAALGFVVMIQVFGSAGSDRTFLIMGLAAVGLSSVVAFCVGAFAAVLDARIGSRKRSWSTPLLAFSACILLSWPAWSGFGYLALWAFVPALVAMLSGQALGMRFLVSDSASNQGIERTPSALD